MTNITTQSVNHAHISGFHQFSVIRFHFLEGVSVLRQSDTHIGRAAIYVQLKTGPDRAETYPANIHVASFFSILQ